MRAAGFLLAWLCFTPVAAAAADANQGPQPAESAQPAMQTSGGPASAGMPPQPQIVLRTRAAFEGVSAQMRSDQSQLRHDLLALLTPVQRAGIAATLGQLAVAADPDAVGAARRIDAALSPGQRQTVMQLAQVAAARAQAAMEQVFSQSQRELSQAAQVPEHDSVIIQGGVAPAGNPNGRFNPGSFPPPGAFSAALASESAGTLIIEILSAGSLETLHPQPTLAPPKLH